MFTFLAIFLNCSFESNLFAFLNGVIMSIICLAKSTLNRSLASFATSDDVSAAVTSVGDFALLPAKVATGDSVTLAIDDKHGFFPLVPLEWGPLRFLVGTAEVDSETADRDVSANGVLSSIGTKVDCSASQLGGVH